MGIQVKICGIRSLEDLRGAVEAGADAIGFLVGLDYPSDDALAPAEAGRLAAGAPDGVARILVTHRTRPAEVAELAREGRYDGVQLHGAFPLASIPALRDALPGVRIVGVVHVDGEGAGARAEAVSRSVDALVLDTRTADRLGGTGTVHDWSLSARIVAAAAKPVILAGGLTPANVAAAVRTVRPYGVDVNSGVEDAGGAKDRAKLRAFVAAARAASS